MADTEAIKQRIARIRYIQTTAREMAKAAGQCFDLGAPFDTDMDWLVDHLEESLSQNEELLAALEEILDIWDGPKMNLLTAEATMAKARAAIAKAKGGAA